MRNELGRFDNGHVPWTKGKKRSEWCDKPSIKRKINCTVCKNKMLKFPSQIKEKNYCCRECYNTDRSLRIKSGDIKNNLPKDVSGENNPNYKNGVWILYNKIRTGKVKSKCKKCGIEFRGRKMHIHHINRNRDDNSEINLIILCSKCHGKEHVGCKRVRRVEK